MKREYVESQFGFLNNFDPDVLFLLIALVVLLFWTIGIKQLRKPKRWSSKYTRKSFKPQPYKNKAEIPAKPNMADPQAQIEAVSKVSFEKRRLMNKGDYRALLVLERTLNELETGHRVMAQTSLGELIQPRRISATEEIRKNAFASINSKRLDFAIVDKFGLLSLALELQGTGHFLHHKTFIRDAVKREALRRAGVLLIEIPSKWRAEDLSAQVRDALA